MIEAHPFRPFIDRWPQMAPRVQLGRVNLGAAPTRKVERAATPRERENLRIALDAYIAEVQRGRKAIRAAIDAWWEDYTSGPIDYLAAQAVFNEDDLAKFQWNIDASEQTALNIRQIAEEIIQYGTITDDDGNTRTATNIDLSRIYGLLATNAEGFSDLASTIRSLIPSEQVKGILFGFARDIRDFFVEFSRISRLLLSAVGEVAEGIAQGTRAVAWLTPAVVVVGVGFVLFTYAMAFRKKVKG